MTPQEASTAMAHLVVHFEISGSDPERLIEFYRDAFGWTFTEFPGMDYWTIETGAGSTQAETPGWGINGGLTRRSTAAPKQGDPIAGANIVIGTDDVDTLFASAIEAGGSVAMALESVPGVGRLGYVFDPDNNLVGLISPER